MLARLPPITLALPRHRPFDVRRQGIQGDLCDREVHRLPIEGEWEYAARAWLASPHADGDNLLTGDENECSGSLQMDKGALPDDIAIYCRDASCCPSVLGSAGTNARNLHGMRGNVGGWDHDRSDGSDCPADDVDPSGQTPATHRLMRGFSYDDKTAEVRSACCFSKTPSGHYPYFGFRVAGSR